MLILLRLVMNFLTNQCFIAKYQLVLSKMKLFSRTKTLQIKKKKKETKKTIRVKTHTYYSEVFSGHFSLSRISK